jgi:hypothetical protein
MIDTQQTYGMPAGYGFGGGGGLPSLSVRQNKTADAHCHQKLMTVIKDIVALRPDIVGPIKTS